MLLETIDVQVSYSQLLSILDIKPWGTPHRNILKLAELVPDVRVIYRQGTLTDLFGAVDRDNALVVFVWTGDLPYWEIETWHAVVIAGYDAQDFYVNWPIRRKATSFKWNSIKGGIDSLDILSSAGANPC